MNCIIYLTAALMLTLVIPAVGQEIPMFSDTLWHYDGNKSGPPFNGKSNGCVFAPGNNTLYSGTEAGLITLYDAETGALKDTILLEQMIIYGLDVNADGSRIFVYVKDTAAGRYLYKYYSLVIEYPSKQVIADTIPWAGHASKISPDGRFIASAGMEQRYGVQVWESGDRAKAVASLSMGPNTLPVSMSCIRIWPPTETIRRLSPEKAN